MTVVGPRSANSAHRALLVAWVGLGLVSLVVPLGLHVPSPGPPAATRGPTLAHPEFVTSIRALGPVPSEGVVGTPLVFAWQALGSSGARATTFTVACYLTVVASSNGSNVRAWVNASTSGAVVRLSNGTFSVPAAAWAGGVLNVTVSIASAEPVVVRLFGPLLPSVLAPVALTVLPDLEHLVLFDPISGPLTNGNRTADTYWHVRDRFGDPTPGAYLILESSSGAGVTKELVPVAWSTGGTTGAWVNYTAPGSGNASYRVLDQANSTLIGPVAFPALSSPVAPATAALPPLVLLGLAGLGASAVVGMVALAVGGRVRPEAPPTDAEEELRRLAEGRATVVELVRRAGALALEEIESAWEPPPAPPAIADWVASLVTDGTLTAALGDGGRARFALAERVVEEPKVTFDEAALEREIARRDAAVGAEDEPERRDPPE